MPEKKKPTVRARPLTTKKLLSWNRGPLWDYICVTSGLKNVDLNNAHILVKQSPLRYSGDATYNLVNGTSRRVAFALTKVDSGLLEEARKALLDLGVNGAGVHGLSTYYGRLISFAWHNSATNGGANFTPIYGKIGRLARKKPQDATKLQTIQRRLVYLEVVGEEIQQAESAFDYPTIPTLQEWLSCLTETFATRCAEVALLITEYHMATKNGLSRRLRFEELLEALSGVSRIFESINSALEGFLLVSLRNHIVHSPEFDLAHSDGRFCLRVSFGRKEKLFRFGVMRDYLKDQVMTLKFAKEAGRVNRNGKTYILFRDNRFPFVTFATRKSKKGTMVLDDCELMYDLTLKEFVNTESSFLFSLARELLA